MMAMICSFSSCVGDDSTGNSGSSGELPKPVYYTISVNGKDWSVLSSKCFLIDNAKQSPDSYEYDYTMRIIAVDASNNLNADSKQLSINFNAEDIETIKGTNLAAQQEFNIQTRIANNARTLLFQRNSGVMTATKVEKEKIAFTFNELEVEADLPMALPGQPQTTSMVINGDIVCLR